MHPAHRALKLAGVLSSSDRGIKGQVRTWTKLCHLVALWPWSKRPLRLPEPLVSQLEYGMIIESNS